MMKLLAMIYGRTCDFLLHGHTGPHFCLIINLLGEQVAVGAENRQQLILDSLLGPMNFSGN